MQNRNRWEERSARTELPDGRELECTVHSRLCYVGGRNLPDEWEDSDPEFSIDGGPSLLWEELPPDLIPAAIELHART